MVDDFSDIFSDSVEGELSDSPLPFEGYDDSDSLFSSSKSSDEGYDGDSDIDADEAVSPGNVCRRLLLDTTSSDRQRMQNLAGVYQQQSATRNGCVRDQVVCELFLHADGRFHHMRTHSRDSHYDLAASTPMFLPSSSEGETSQDKEDEPGPWWRISSVTLSPRKLDIIDKSKKKKKTHVKRRNTICAKASSSSSNNQNDHNDTWWAVLTDGVWCVDDDSDTILLHIERDKFCAGPNGQQLATPEFAGELESSSPQLKVGKDGVVASRAVCSLQVGDNNILTAEGPFPGQFCRWYNRRNGF